MLYLSKFLQIFAYPLGWVLLLLTGGLVLHRRRRTSVGLIAGALLVLWLFSCPIVSEALLYTLETQTPFMADTAIPAAPAIVVLGDFVRMPTRERPVPEVAGGNRLLRGLDLYRAGKAPLLVLSGGNVSFLAGGGPRSQAEIARDVLEKHGVPESAILPEGRSQTTAENAEFTAALLQPRGIRRVLLVTSAFHMPRALACFRHAGLEPVPVATGYLTGWPEPDLLFRWLPSPECLTLSSIALKEWVGLGVYRLTGRS